MSDGLPPTTEDIVLPSKPSRLRRIMVNIAFLLTVLAVAAVLFSLLTKRPIFPRRIFLKGMPKSYNECLISGYKQDRYSCIWSVSWAEKGKEYDKCVGLGGEMVSVDPGPTSCSLIYYIPNFTFPKSFEECKKNFGVDELNYPNKCLVIINTKKAYDKIYSQDLFAECKKNNGVEQEGECFIVFEKLPQHNRLASNYSDCVSFAGSPYIDYFEPLSSEAGITYEIKRCDLDYNSENTPALYRECIQRGGEIIAVSYGDKGISSGCKQYYAEIPPVLRPTLHPAVVWKFENIYKDPIHKVAVSKNRVFLGLGYKGIYAVDSQSGKSRWYFKTEFFDDLIVDNTGEHLIVNIGANEKIRLVDIDSESGKERWRYEMLKPDKSFFTYEIKDGEVIIIFSKYENNATQRLKQAHLGLNDGILKKEEPLSESILNNPDAWKKEIPFKNLIISNDNDGLKAVEQQTRTLVWNYEYPKSIKYIPSISEKNLIKVGDESLLLIWLGRKLIALQPESGKVKWDYCGLSSMQLLFWYTELSPGLMLVEGTDWNLYGLDLSKIPEGDSVDFFKNTELACK
ncbi:PQQ-binding-like beta-propeller repeat protein [Candidatus Roizmanbacteria bacterium]|nr:PQQ-binding-like beta-propeller repeat protein [Candidatus Roizmanbacteria bacterium]